MKFKTLSIDNFLAIGHVTLELDELGLVLIQGINEDGSSASSNGAGKSTLGDALSFVLFGKTARGLAGDAVVNRTVGKDACVALWLEDDGETYVVRRYRKHGAEGNRLTLHQVDNGQELDLTKGTDKLTQDAVEALIGCSYEVFSVAVYAGQERFPDLPGMTDKPLKVLIEEAAGIDRLQRAYEVARERLNKTKTQYEAREVELLRLEDQLQTLGRRQGDLLAQIADWERQQTAQREQWAAEALSKRETAAQLSATLASHQQEQSLQAALNTIHKRLTAGTDPAQAQALESAVAQSTAFLASAQQVEATCRRELDLLRHEQAHLDQKVGKLCGECGKVYSAGDLSQASAALNQRMARAIAALEQATQSAAGLGAQHTQAKSALDAYRQQLPDVSKLVVMQRQLQEEQQSIARTKQAIAQLLSDAGRLEQQALAPAVNPLEQALKGLQEDLAGVARMRMAVEEQREQLGRDLVLIKDAVDVFAPSGVRAQILDTVTPFLNDRTANYLGTLSDGDITATWQTLTRNSKGELKEKFTIDVTSLTGGGDFKSLSGGEKRKVRLATAMALADLVASRATKPISLLVADEIDDAVDASGLERLMAVLEEKARERGSLLVISHNDLAGYIRQTITIRKSNGIAELV